MKRTMRLSAIAALTVLIIFAVSTAAQHSQKTKGAYKKNSTPITRQSEPVQASAKIRTYAPRIKGRSASFVIEGLISKIEDNLIIIKTERGERYNFKLDDQTSVIRSDELVSIATMADIALSISDLHVSDRVEIVTERLGKREVARIITRIESSDSQVAKR
jgi:hypothetical protein